MWVCTVHDSLLIDQHLKWFDYELAVLGILMDNKMHVQTE